MDHRLQVEIEMICTSHIFAIVLTVIFLMIFIIRAKRDFSLYAFIVMQMSIIGWMIFKIIKTVSPVLWVRWWSIVSYYFFVCAYEVAFLNFTYTNNKGKLLPLKINIGLVVLAFIQFSFVLTNPLHYKFYATFDFFSDTFGPLFYLHTVVEYIIFMIAIYHGGCYFLRGAKDKSLVYKVMMTVAILAPLILNFLYIIKRLEWLIRLLGITIIFDITPIVFTFSIGVFVYGTFRHDFVKVSPILRHQIVQKLNTPLCVMNISNKIIYTNSKMQEILGRDAAAIIENALKKCSDSLSTHCQSQLKIDQKIFLIDVAKVLNISRTQYLITFNDITEYKSVERKIKAEQLVKSKINSELNQAITKLKKASKAGARRYVAQELHDIIGHSLVVTIKSLEVAKMYIKKNKQLAEEALSDSALALADGIKAMTDVHRKKVKRDGYMLKTEISRILSRFRHVNIKTHYDFKGDRYVIRAEIFDIVVKVCQELITNAIKHAKPSALFVAIEISNELINIRIIDNGQGTDCVKDGNGLIGIKERLSKVNGHIAISTAKGDGFMGQVYIPNR